VPASPFACLEKGLLQARGGPGDMEVSLEQFESLCLAISLQLRFQSGQHRLIALGGERDMSQRRKRWAGPVGALMRKTHRLVVVHGNDDVGVFRGWGILELPYGLIAGWAPQQGMMRTSAPHLRSQGGAKTTPPCRLHRRFIQEFKEGRRLRKARRFLQQLVPSVLNVDTGQSCIGFKQPHHFCATVHVERHRVSNFLQRMCGRDHLADNSVPRWRH